jgi:hypothetical protein
MRYILLILLFCLSFVAAKAQNQATVKGVVLDSVEKIPVQFVTVSVLRLKDSSLVAYTITDKTGAFTLRDLGNEPCRLLVSHVGFHSLHIPLNFEKSKVIDLGKIYLSEKDLQEVTIKGERVPVTIKKDTIEFDAEAFKTRPNAVVEDLLKKLPGVQVNTNGGITVNGKDVSKIKINGKDFFVNDLTIATRNLEASMISKIQVYDDRENDPDHLIPEYDVKKVINLKFKKSFAKGILSTLGAGGGTQDRYVVSGFIAKFQDDLQLSAKLNSDNLSTTGNFSGNYGGFSNYSFGNFGNTGIKKDNSGNLDFTKDISKTVKLHLEYRFSGTTTDNNSTQKAQQTLNDTLLTTLAQSAQHQQANDQNLHAEMEWKPDTLTIVKYTPDMEYIYNTNQTQGSSVNSSNYLGLLNTNITGDHGSNNSFQYRHNLNYYRKLNKKGASFTLANTFSIAPTHSLDFNTNYLDSYIAALSSDTLSRFAKNTSNDIAVSLSATYHYPITKKLSADVTLLALHDQNKGELLTYDQNFQTGLYNIFLQDQSSDLIRTLWGESLTPQLTYNFTDDISVKAGVVALSQQIGNHFNSYTSDLNQNFFYLFPSGEVHVKHFTLSYSESVQQPSINDLQPITIVYSPLYTFIGDPGLKPTYYHHFNLQYNNYDPQSRIFLFFNSSVVIEQNTIVHEQSISPEGANLTTPINRNGRFTTNLNGSITKSSKKHGKWQFTLTANMNATAGHNFFIINQQNGYQNTQNIIFSPDFRAEWNDVIAFEPSYHINFATTQYQLVNYPNTNYTMQTAGMLVDISLPESFNWKTNYAYNYNPISSPGFQQRTNLLNFSFTKRIQKSKGEIGIVAYDLLNQNVSATHYVVANTVNDVQNQVQRRYLLLTYTYHFKKFK